MKMELTCTAPFDVPRVRLVNCRPIFDPEDGDGWEVVVTIAEEERESRHSLALDKPVQLEASVYAYDPATEQEKESDFQPVHNIVPDRVFDERTVHRAITSLRGKWAITQILRSGPLAAIVASQARAVLEWDSSMQKVALNLELGIWKGVALFEPVWFPWLNLNQSHRR